MRLCARDETERGDGGILGMSKDFTNITDEELLDRLKGGEESVIDYFMDKYKNLVRNKAQSMYILGADSEDLIQEGMIGLFKAIRDYDCGRDASFFTFAELCVNRQMYKAVQSAKRQKHAPLNTYISLYGNEEKESGERGESLADSLSSRTDLNPEDILIDRESAEELERRIGQELSSFENQVLDLYMTGMSYSQIAKVLGRSEKSTDNALQRVKSKVRRMIREREQ